MDLAVPSFASEKEGTTTYNIPNAPPWPGVRTMITTKYADLAPEQVKQVQHCEEELGVTIVAYAKPAYAELSEENLNKIQDLEKSLGLSLVAYRV